MPSINELIDKHDWSMLSWRERYGNGVWVALAPAVPMLQNIEIISTGNDIQSIELSSYFLDKGIWLPVVKGDTINAALSKLDLKVFSVPEKLCDKWMSAVWDAYEKVYDLGRENGYILKAAIDSKDKSLLVQDELQEYLESIKNLNPNGSWR